MNRPSTIVGLAAVTLALLTGCGKESNSASACRDEFVQLYEEIIKLLNDASPSDPDIDAKMKDVLGVEPRCKKQGARIANDTLEQVAQEFDSRLAALEGKWGSPSISGFRDPLGAGHGPPVPQGTPSGGPQSATPSATTQP
jgi:hypothetical protein